MPGIVSSMTAVVSANTTAFQSGMKKAEGSVKRFQFSAKNLERIGKRMTKVGKQMSLAITAPLALLGGLAVKTFASFEQEMAKVQAVSGATGEVFSDLRQLAENLGKSTRFTASEVAALQLNYSKLGFVPSEIQKITASTLNLALATGEELADSAEVAGATMRQFGLTAEQMPDIIDVMALSFSSSALTLQKFQDAMKSVAPVSKAVGATLEDTTAVLATLTDSGIDASTAGTSLRNIFIRLSEQGITWDQAMNQVRNSTDKVKTAVKLFGVRAAASGLIIAENEDKIRKLTTSFENAEGSAKKMATIMDDTLQGSMLRVKSALEGLAISFGEMLAPAIKFIGEKIAILANWFQALTPETKKFIVVAAGIAVAIGPALVALGFLSTTIIPALIAGFAVLTGPIGLTVIAISALAAAFIAFSGEVKRARNIQELMNDVTKEAKKSIVGEMVELKKLLRIAKNETISKETRLKAIKDLNEVAPDYLGNITLETINTDKARISIEKYSNAILAKAKAQVVSNKITELTTKLVETEMKDGEEFVSTWEKMANTFTSSEFQMREWGGTLEQLGVKRKTGEIKILEAELNRLITIQFSATTSTGDLSEADQNLTEEIDKQREALEKRRKELEKTKKLTEEEFKAMQKKETGAKRIPRAGEVGPAIREPVLLDIKAVEENMNKVGRVMERMGDGISRTWEEKMTKMAEDVAKFADIVGQIAGMMGNIFAINTEKKMIALEEAHAREVEMIEASRMSEEAKTKALEALDEKTAKKRKELQRKQAIADKLSAMFSAALAAGVAITVALGTMPPGAGIPAAIATGILAAAQIGIIAAQPIPLAEGGIATQPTIALIGEKKPEAVIPLDRMRDMGFNFELKKIISAEDIVLVLSRYNKRLSFTS